MSQLHNRLREETRFSTYEELKEEGYLKVDIDLERWYRGEDTSKWVDNKNQYNKKYN